MKFRSEPFFTKSQKRFRRESPVQTHFYELCKRFRTKGSILNQSFQITEKVLLQHYYLIVGIRNDYDGQLVISIDND